MKAALFCLGCGLLLIGGAFAGAHANRPGMLRVESDDPPPPADPLSGPRVVRSVLRNVGGRPVRIRAVEASCGCAKPTVTPTTVPPGGQAVVEAEIVRPAGSGAVDVTIMLHTDSPSSPVMTLTHRVVETRKVPYLSLVSGELTFRGAVGRGMTRDLYVSTVEPPGLKIVPEPRSDLPFLEMVYVSATNSDPTEDGSIVRSYRYLLRVADDPPAGTTVGEVTVEDPWNPGRIERANVILQVGRPANGSDAAASDSSPGGRSEDQAEGHPHGSSRG
jgi:hypothetical protein